MVQLPREVPTGRAEIVVLMPSPEAATPSRGVARLVGMLRTTATPDDAAVQRNFDNARTERGGA